MNCGQWEASVENFIFTLDLSGNATAVGYNLQQCEQAVGSEKWIVQGGA